MKYKLLLAMSIAVLCSCTSQNKKEVKEVPLEVLDRVAIDNYDTLLTIETEKALYVVNKETKTMVSYDKKYNSFPEVAMAIIIIIVLILVVAVFNTD